MADNKPKDEKQKPLFQTAYVPNGKETEDVLWCPTCRTQTVNHRVFPTFDFWACVTCKKDCTEEKIRHEYQLPPTKAPSDLYFGHGSPDTTIRMFRNNTSNPSQNIINGVLREHIDLAGTSGICLFFDSRANAFAKFDTSHKELIFLQDGIYTIEFQNTHTGAKLKYVPTGTRHSRVLFLSSEVFLNVTKLP